MDDMEVDETRAELKVHQQTLTTWVQTERESIWKINVDILKELQLLWINANLPVDLTKAAEED